MTPYVYNIVLDLEFTPIARSLRPENLNHEIIEIGAVKCLPDGTVVEEFDRMVKPQYAQGITSKVRRITGIRDEDLLFARPLAQVLDEFRAWIGSERCRIVTWSPCDRAQIDLECAIKGLDADLPGRWLDIQRLYPRLMGIRRRSVALGEAADWCGIGNDRNKAHRALYDAQMTAEIFAMMAQGNCKEQRERLEREVGAKSEHTQCSSTIESRCAGLKDLLQTLRELEGAA